MTKKSLKVTRVSSLIITIILGFVAFITFDSDINNENWSSFITMVLAMASFVTFLFTFLYSQISKEVS